MAKTRPDPIQDDDSSVMTTAHRDSPYDLPGFYDRALAQGRHREITGGWWEETGRIQLDLLTKQGMQPGHLLLDVGAGALRLGARLCRC